MHIYIYVKDLYAQNVVHNVNYIVNQMYLVVKKIKL
jgi:hypothetical protein